MADDEDPRVALEQLRERYFAEASEIGERLAAWESFKHMLANALGVPAETAPSTIVALVEQMTDQKPIGHDSVMTGRCRACGYNVVVIPATNPDRSEWYYCANKACENHSGEQLDMEHEPEWLEVNP